MKRRISDLTNRILLAGLGAVALTKDKAEKLVDELVAEGELTRGEVSKLLDNLVKKGKNAHDDMRQLIKKEVEKIFKELNVASKKDVDDLKKRIARLEKRLSR